MAASASWRRPATVASASPATSRRWTLETVVGDGKDNRGCRESVTHRLVMFWLVVGVCLTGHEQRPPAELDCPGMDVGLAEQGRQPDGVDLLPRECLTVQRG